MCIRPIYKNYRTENGKIKIDWKSSGLKSIDKLVIKLPCGRCVECQRKRSAEWASRCLLEAREYKDNCIVTLTYRETDGILHKRDYQLFLKRLRKKIFPQKIKYFCAGEYGKKGARPHFHIIIFGYRPKDLILQTRDGIGTQLYSSRELESLWGHGFISVGDLSYKSCLYSAKYLQKSVYDKCKKEGIQPPFLAMSKGIAANAAYKVDYNVDRIYINGKAYIPPRYFDKLQEREGVDLSEVKEKRKRSDIYLRNWSTNIPSIDEVRESENTERVKEYNEKNFTKY